MVLKYQYYKNLTFIAYNLKINSLDENEVTLSFSEAQKTPEVKVAVLTGEDRETMKQKTPVKKSRMSMPLVSEGTSLCPFLSSFYGSKFENIYNTSTVEADPVVYPNL